MENVMTNGFCELNEQEMMMTDGGWNPVTALTNFLRQHRITCQERKNML